ncbi:BAR domain-containing protein [Aphelenchoides besseyi]|nr:BAR domain-containing protein [Aphelenchoides besseyi]
MSTPGNNGGMNPRTKSSSNQTDQSKKMADAPVPMELADPAQAAEEPNMMKKFFMKIGERVGTVQKTEFPSDYLQAVAEVLEAARASAKEMAKAQRQFQVRVRKYMHFHRTFLLVDYANLSEERKKLMHRRQEMDYARHDYTNNPNDARRLSFERAEQRYNDQMHKILGILNNLPAIKKQHADEIMYIMVEMHNFHKLCQLECEKLRVHRHAMGPETPYELL